MLRLVLIAGSFLLSMTVVVAQLSKLYALSDSDEFDTVAFHLKASATNCLISQSKSSSAPLVIYGDPNLDKIHPQFLSQISNGTSHSRLILDQYHTSSIGDSFSFAVSRNDKENDFWKIHYGVDKIYRLYLNYGFGNADVNLTGSAVHRLKIKSGSADIIVGYDEGSRNEIQMDTFFIKSDFGSIVARHMEATRAKKVITKVGFGNVLLDFDKRQTEKCEVDAHVGAGNLEVILPSDDTPVIIYLKDSPLCAVKIADGFEEVEDNVFVNMSYRTNAVDLLSFNVDVALGMVRFRYH